MREMSHVRLRVGDVEIFIEGTEPIYSLCQQAQESLVKLLAEKAKMAPVYPWATQPVDRGPVRSRPPYPLKAEWADEMAQRSSWSPPNGHKE